VGSNPLQHSSGFDIDAWKRRLRVAQGFEPADLVISGARVVNVFSGDLESGDVAIVDGRIAAVGDFPDALERLDATGMTLAPSFIDAHIHLESSLVWPSEFARAVVPHGTGAVITDPHEFANVAGIRGVDAVRKATLGLPLTVRFTIPSCVPASPFESPGAVFGVDEITEALNWPESVGLGELMNFPGVLAGAGEIAVILAAAEGRRRDGHAPGLRGKAVQAYAGSGTHSDHESTTLDEARDKLRAGLMVMIREGSTEHNLHELLSLVTDLTYPRCCFASDDRDCHSLLHDGHMDAILRGAIEGGLDPVRAIRMATWNTADYWRLEGIGAVAPGYEANLVLLRDLERVEVAATFYRGKLVAKDGAYLFDQPTGSVPDDLSHSVHVAPVMLRHLALEPNNAKQAVGAIHGQIVTKRLDVEPKIVNGQAVADVERDLLKLVCIERHNASGRVGVGYVHGFGLKRGAMASTISHDAHNIVAVGVGDVDLLAAIALVAESQGGLAVVADGQILGHLPLPIAGLLSDRPLEEVAATYDQLEQAARDMGSTLPSPFGLLAFMALTVIPEARVTDRGFFVVGA